MFHIFFKSRNRTMRSGHPILPNKKFSFRETIFFSNEVFFFFSFLLKPWKPRFIIEFFFIKPIEFFVEPTVLLEHHLLDPRNPKMNQLLPTCAYPFTVPVFPRIHHLVLVVFDLLLKIFNFFFSFPYLPLFDVVRHWIQAIGEEGSRVVLPVLLRIFPDCPLFCQ